MAPGGPASQTSDELALAREGRTLNGKWTLVRLLGVGGMGAVYAAKHRNGTRAAVKVLHRAYARHAEVRERFRREGYAANRIEHPGVVKVLEDDVVSDGPDAGSAYLVMELLEGESLQDRLELGVVIGERGFLEIADGVLDVLRVAHGCGVVHRDLKPENLFFHQEADGRTRIKVLDFGMARLLDQQAITTYGMALGTPSFMAPEQAAGRLDEIDGRTDLFALATTGFRLRTGRRIHEADHPVELVRRMSQVPAPPIRSLSPDASAPYARVIDKALQFRREDRYANAEAMQADVRRALTQLSYGAIAPPPLPAPAHRSVKRRGGVVWLALIACIGAGVALFVGSRMSGSGVASGPSASASSVIVDGGAPTRPWMDASTARPPGPIPMQRPVPVPPPNPSSR